MRHDIRVDGIGFRLRPIKIEDAAFVVEIRTAHPERTRFVHSVSPDVKRQEDWIAEYLERTGDYYWTVERRDDGSSEGVVGIYDFDPAWRRAEWGRWVLRPGSIAAVESAMLVHRAAFDHLGLEVLISNTNAENLAVVAFHKSCGIRCSGLQSDYFNINGRRCDAVRHECSRGEWPQLEARLLANSQLVARHLRTRT